MSHRYPFDFDAAYRVAALPFGVTPRTAYVEVEDDALKVRFGLWRLETTRSNITEANLSGDYAFIKTAGPPHLSFSDKGVTFATNGRVGVCLQLHTPVPGIDPTKRILHPGVTLTLADSNEFLDWAKG